MDHSATAAKSAIVAPAQPLSLRLTSNWRMYKGRLKIIIGFSLQLAGAYGILSEQNCVSSSDAVVSTYVVIVRTPIDRLVQGGRGPARSTHARPQISHRCRVRRQLIVHLFTGDFHQDVEFVSVIRVARSLAKVLVS